MNYRKKLIIKHIVLIPTIIICSSAITLLIFHNFIDKKADCTNKDNNTEIETTNTNEFLNVEFTSGMNGGKKVPCLTCGVSELGILDINFISTLPTDMNVQILKYGYEYENYGIYNTNVFRNSDVSILINRPLPDLVVPLLNYSLLENDLFWRDIYKIQTSTKRYVYSNSYLVGYNSKTNEPLGNKMMTTPNGDYFQIICEVTNSDKVEICDNFVKSLTVKDQSKYEYAFDGINSDMGDDMSYYSFKKCENSSCEIILINSQNNDDLKAIPQNSKVLIYYNRLISRGVAAGTSYAELSKGYIIFNNNEISIDY